MVVLLKFKVLESMVWRGGTKKKSMKGPWNTITFCSVTFVALLKEAAHYQGQGIPMTEKKGEECK